MGGGPSLTIMKAMIHAVPQRERIDMNLLLMPVMANLYYVGGGSLGTLILIVVVVMLLRR